MQSISKRITCSNATPLHMIHKDTCLGRKACFCNTISSYRNSGRSENLGERSKGDFRDGYKRLRFKIFKSLLQLIFLWLYYIRLYSISKSKLYFECWHLRPTQFPIFIVLLQNVKILKRNNCVLSNQQWVFL